ncbi:urea ABC transporter permease subunit UrtB [Pseudoalteromonas phenolica]|uniref:Branched-chain amino acid ABC transporter permease n=1 Tax=Pseudoalteromonas phenolica TaxID=161398 RepID=A0A0S2K901_9GAMM|nr:urea ABC transporter permease subunit UrtB [Pseudoalteromonas phenolica]ALO44463.1 Branched-chain amino acid ABC transporter permease [Pseudoalteromonas phenolica]MBE0357481.1 urea transport system permease protein [Pseudoalteromonas phenolica O-BC30]RXF07218.1 urea ABC transporter permease subunit UrtB [Pseudoalteromonas phenolica O-BC30]
MLRFILLIFVCLVPTTSWSNNISEIQASTSDIIFTPAVNKLSQAKLKDMPEVVENISNIQDPRTRDVLSDLLKGQLFYLKSNKQLVRAIKNQDDLYDLIDIFSAQPLEALPKSHIKKVRTNNRVRQLIRSKIAYLDLTSRDDEVRYQAVKQVLDKPSENSLMLIKTLAIVEKNQEIKALMETTLLIEQLSVPDPDEKLSAVLKLTNNLEPAVKVALQAELDVLDADRDPVLKSAIEAALNNISQQQSFYSILENLFFGLSLGSVLLLAAIGLAITFGVMGVINMAHGEMIMLGAYTTYVIQTLFPELLNYSLLIAVPAAFLVSGLVGVMIERGIIRHLKGRPLETLLATFGVSLVLQQLVRSVFSPLNRTVASPEWMSGSLQINPVLSLTYSRLYIIIFSFIVFIALLLILKKTSLGLHVRAVSQNRNMARALSIKSNWVDAITFGLGSGIAGVAGVVLSQLTNVGPNLGQAYIIDSFLVVVFGGVGNLWGTLVAALSLGVLNKVLEPLTGTVLASIIVLIGLVLFIQKRPKGLFPQKGRSA